MGSGHRASTATIPLFELERGEITEDGVRPRGWPSARWGPASTCAGCATCTSTTCSPNAEMIDFVRELRGRGLRTALLTNNVREWEPLWRAKLPEIDELFEIVVDSGFVGMRKPDPEIYELTLERLGGPSAGECVFLDDIEVNCEAAREPG